MSLAQGFVEVSSYVAAIEAADAMAKGADVTIKRVHKVDGPIVTVICEGDVAACKAAVDVACSICQPKGTLLAHSIIPRPEGGGQLLYDCLDNINAKKAAKKAAKNAARDARMRAVRGNKASAQGAPAQPAQGKPADKAPNKPSGK